MNKREKFEDGGAGRASSEPGRGAGKKPPRQGVPTDLRRNSSPAHTTVKLAPGGSARSLLHWTVVPAPDEAAGACEPTAVTVVVTPPDQTTAALQPWTLGPVCQHGRIDQNAYVAGGAAF